MIEAKTYSSVRTYSKYDPTRTTSLRNEFARQMRKRFDELTRAIATAIVTEDVFGMNREELTVMQVTTPGPEAFAFATSQKKIEAFMLWLREQAEKGILEWRTFQQIGTAVEEAWTNMYIYDSYKRGVIRARMELIKAGYNVPPLEETGGIIASMSTPFHMDRVGLLFIRVFNDLKGITDAMDAQISRVLAEGMVHGDGPRLIARKLVATVNGRGVGDLGITDTLGRFIPAKRRAEILARTEIIRAHHLATIQEYRNWGVVGVQVQAEWKTAGDDRVCPICASMEGNIYTLDEIEGMIPAHPQCRCIALPKLMK